MIAKIISDIALDREFEYLVPDSLAGKLRIGSSVSIPFGASVREGWIISLSDTQVFNGKLKEIIAHSDKKADIPANLIELGKWIAEYYCSSLEQAIRTLLPAAVRNGRIKELSCKVFYIPNKKQASDYIVAHAKKAPSRCELLEYFLKNDRPVTRSVLRRDAKSESALTALLKENIIASRNEIIHLQDVNDEPVPTKPLPPTPAQAEALKIINSMLDGKSKPAVLLLHGTTNSGKTEVYLQAIAKTLEQGKSAIVLVPEISLTPQTLRRFKARFGNTLSVLHSQLTERERFNEWNKINRGKVKIAIGARSALFAPFTNLGLIVIDEEHESSYKQSEAPRYHTRDVAVMRGKIENAVVILGSATPSAESCYNARCGKFQIAKMAEQVGHRPPPKINIIDLHKYRGKPGESTALFSPPLIEAVNDRIERREQVILFLNRRGYAHTLTCQCGYEFQCPQCKVNYVYSRRRNILSCHWCGTECEAPGICPACGNDKLLNFRPGTEKIENVAMGIFHNAHIARMDSDTMRSKEDYEITLEDFRRGKIDILIGTQMIAKGLHFPNVTLVGVINPDIGLAIPDFRSPERTFQLLAQVAGRAGRGDRPGEVIIQTNNPDNEVIRYASVLDFDGFKEYDFEVREMLRYPPFGRLIVLHFKGKDEEQVYKWSQYIDQQLRPYINQTMTYTSPAPAPLPMLKGFFRYIAIIRGENLSVIRQALRILAFHRTPPRGVDFFVDVDAQNIF